MKEMSNLIINTLGGLIPELTLSYIIMKLTDEGWFAFWMTYIAIQLFYLIVWIFRSIVSAVIYKAYGKRIMVKAIYESLIKYRYPSSEYAVDTQGQEKSLCEWSSKS